MDGCSTTVPSPSEPTAVDDDRGLTDAEVRERVADGRRNIVPDAPVRTLGEIFRANVFTRVNAIIGVLFVLILAIGRPKDSLFAAVIVSNAVIGIVQELRARKTLNELALLERAEGPGRARRRGVQRRRRRGRGRRPARAPPRVPGRRRRQGRRVATGSRSTNRC